METHRVEQPLSDWDALVRHVAVIGLAGLVTGVLVGGLGSRIFMRVAGATGRFQGATTEAGFSVGEVTLGGTIGLVIFVGIFIGIIGAALFVVFHPWLDWAGRYRGLVYGVVLFAVGSASSDAMNPDNPDFFILGNDVVNVVAIVVLFLTFGVVMDLIHRAFDRRTGGPTAVHAAIAVVGLVIAPLLLISTMFTNSGCDCDPPILASSFVVVAAVGTALWWGSGVRPSLRQPAVVLGWIGLLGAVGFGLVRAIVDAVEILA